MDNRSKLATFFTRSGWTIFLQTLTSLEESLLKELSNLKLYQVFYVGINNYIESFLKTHDVSKLDERLTMKLIETLGSPQDIISGISTPLTCTTCKSVISILYRYCPQCRTPTYKWQSKSMIQQNKIKFWALNHIVLTSIFFLIFGGIFALLFSAADPTSPIVILTYLIFFLQLNVLFRFNNSRNLDSFSRQIMRYEISSVCGLAVLNYILYLTHFSFILRVVILTLSIFLYFWYLIRRNPSFDLISISLIQHKMKQRKNFLNRWKNLTIVGMSACFLLSIPISIFFYYAFRDYSAIKFIFLFFPVLLTLIFTGSQVFYLHPVLKYTKSENL